MKVCRIDLYDFKVTVDEDDFNSLKIVSVNTHTSIETILTDVIAKGFDVLDNGETGKESVNELEGKD